MRKEIEKEYGDVDVDGETGPTATNEYNLATQHDQLERGLKSRHIQFLALGMSHHRKIGVTSIR
jgi:amino acid transporter